jgi:DNA (cytosine-5)-methyltransferase 1
VTRPRLLDLFCGAGGAAVGYHRAGFDVVGVDNRPQPRYPFEFVQADAMTYPLDGYDAVHASPPCQDHSDLSARVGVHGTGWMLQAILDRLETWGGAYVVENVESAPLPEALILCGASFGLGTNGRTLRRHRRFHSNLFLMGPGCACSNRIVGVYGTGGGGQMTRGYKATLAEAHAALGIDWMNRDEISQAIPPAYTQYIGELLLAHLAAEATA